MACCRPSSCSQDNPCVAFKAAVKGTSLRCSCNVCTRTPCCLQGNSDLHHSLQVVTCAHANTAMALWPCNKKDTAVVQPAQIPLPEPGEVQTDEKLSNLECLLFLQYRRLQMFNFLLWRCTGLDENPYCSSHYNAAFASSCSSVHLTST